MNKNKRDIRKYNIYVIPTPEGRREKNVIKVLCQKIAATSSHSKHNKYKEKHHRDTIVKLQKSKDK